MEVYREYYPKEDWIVQTSLVAPGLNCWTANLVTSLDQC